MRSYLVLLLHLALIVSPALPAAQDDPRLDALFEELQSLDKRRDERAGELQARIWQIWYEHDDPAVRQAMETGVKALTRERYQEAVDAFTRVVQLDPDYAEAWNRRGTTYYLMDRFEDSLADIRRVLELEPRHYAALAGRGLCLKRLGRPRAAVEAYEEALEINPHLDRVYVEVIRLRARLDEKAE